MNQIIFGEFYLSIRGRVDVLKLKCRKLRCRYKNTTKSYKFCNFS